MLAPEVIKGMQKAAEYKKLSDRLFAQAMVDALYDRSGKEALDYYLSLIGNGRDPADVLWDLAQDVIKMARIHRIPDHDPTRPSQAEERDHE